MMVNRKTNPVTVADEGNVLAADAEETARLQRALTGRDIIEALAVSPLAEVTFERLSIKSKVRDVSL
jgi:hypothetical protein